MLNQIDYTKKRRSSPVTAEDRNITLKELTAIMGRSRSSVLRDIEAGRIPQPIKFVGKLYWRLSEVKACLNSQQRRVA